MSGGFGAFATQSEEGVKRTTSDRTLASRLYGYAKKYKKNLYIGAAAIVTQAIFSLFSPYMHELAIDRIITPGNLSGFTWWIPLFVAITVGNYLSQYVQVYQMRIVGENVVALIREEMMTKVQAISLRYFSEGEIGRIMARPTSDSNQVRIFLRMGLTTIIMDVAQILGALFMIFFLNMKLALVAVSILPFAFIVAWFMGVISRKAYRRSLTTLGGITSKTQENLAGMKVIKSNVRENESGEDFEKVQMKNVKANQYTIFVSTIYNPIVMYMRIIGTCLILYYGALMVISGEATLGTLVAFIEYQFMYFTPLTSLITAYDQYQAAMAAIERMFDLVDTKVEIEEPPKEKAVELNGISTVKFEDVKFGYDPRVIVIEGINFTLENNKKLAIVGPTGAGKSTIINLLARFYDPLGGNIYIDGHNIKDIPTKSLRSNIGIVLQDSFLFAMSVRDNIRFGKPEATDEEVIAAAKLVGAHDFIMKLPGGYDYILQESSANVSIGQRQLISFARTLLMNPSLIVLDEATSSIDPYTELVIQNALKNLLANRLAIIIAHRLSTIRLCDEIIVLDHGKIVERGSHETLMSNGGLYSSFYRMQFKEESGLDIPSEANPAL